MKGNDPARDSAHGLRDDGSGRGQNSSQADRPDVSVAQLAKASAIALFVAVVILVTTVLPAEFGIDPTGVGTLLNLTAIHEAGDATHDSAPPAAPSAPAAAPEAAPVAALSGAERPMRTDSLSVTLEPGAGAEVKAEMLTGEGFVFEWESDGGPINYDMHGQSADSAGSTSYGAGQQTDGAAGTFVAPADGTHGWFFRNRNDVPVTVTVRTSGFYTRLFEGR